MLDYDKACGRDTPSVACIVDPFAATSRQAAFWGTTPHYLPSNIFLNSYQVRFKTSFIQEKFSLFDFFKG